MTAVSELPVREWGVRIGGVERAPAGGRSLERTMPGRPDRTVGLFRFAGASDRFEMREGYGAGASEAIPGPGTFEDSPTLSLGQSGNGSGGPKPDSPC